VLIDDREQNARAERRLREDTVIWLTTVRADGQPQSTPVWFLWGGDRELFIVSRPNQPKLRNISSNPRISLHFDDHDGDDVVALECEATTSEDGLSAEERATYVEKYRDLIAGLGTDPDSFAADYSVPIRVRITRARAPF
jgi:PPOX class probable F420-dependent enzyme